MSDESKRWESVTGSVRRIQIDTASGTKPYVEFTLNVHSLINGWRGQVVRVEADRLERHPWLYKHVLDLLTRDCGVWDPQ